MAARKPQRGAVRAKGESLTVRIHPKLKYGLELLARKQHRTLTTVVEWALTRALEDEKEGLTKYVNVGDAEFNHYINILQEVWDPWEADRFVNLAMCCPELLSYEEELVWKVIKETKVFWPSSDNKPYFELIRANWDAIQKRAGGENEATFEDDILF